MGGTDLIPRLETADWMVESLVVVLMALSTAMEQSGCPPLLWVSSGRGQGTFPTIDPVRLKPTSICSHTKIQDGQLL